jgi:anthranilate phosphoribosyltransferase
VLSGEEGPQRDIVVLNAAAGLVVSGVSEDIASGMRLARTAIDSGAAERALEALVRVSRDVAAERSN